MRISEFQLLCLALIRANGRGYAYNLSLRLETVLGDRVRATTVSRALSTMEDEGLLTSWLGAPDQSLAGACRRWYRLTEEGHRTFKAEANTALQRLADASQTLHRGLEADGENTSD